MVSKQDLEIFEDDDVRESLTQGNNKLWNYFLDVKKTEQFKKYVDILRGASEQDNIKERIILLANMYGFDGKEWYHCFSQYIYFGRLVKPLSADLCKITTISELAKNLSGINPDTNFLSIDEYPLSDFNVKFNIADNFPIAILINPNASLRDIVDFVSTNYKSNIEVLQKKSQSALVETEAKIGKSKTKKSDIQERNDYIYSHKDLPRKEIMSKVLSRFPKTGDIDAAYIGKIISLETKKRK